jgi:hypothetical protein
MGITDFLILHNIVIFPPIPILELVIHVFLLILLYTNLYMVQLPKKSDHSI